MEYRFIQRLLGTTEEEEKDLCRRLGVKSKEALMEEIIPSTIRQKQNMSHEPLPERQIEERLERLGAENHLYRNYIGQGYYGSHLPAVIRRNLLESPGWYTSYTPYQAEISQGRLEALLNFQTVVCDMTGMEVSNCSLLDEGTAAVEAMLMMYRLRSRDVVKRGVNKFFIDHNIFEQTKDLLRSRAKRTGIEIEEGDYSKFAPSPDFFGVIIQYPSATGEVKDYTIFAQKVHKEETRVGAIADILSLSLLIPPAQWGADIVVGSTQRLGLPMGFGGPHAAYLACFEKDRRHVPGRIIGVTRDRNGNPALRMAIQTREQHIKREKATSNICTAQALLASIAGMFAVWHGPEGLKAIATRIWNYTETLCNSLKKLGYSVRHHAFFDTLTVDCADASLCEKIREYLERRKINIYYAPDKKSLRISLDETVTLNSLNDVIVAFSEAIEEDPQKETVSALAIKDYDGAMKRETPFLQQKVFNSIRSEVAMMRYLKKLERKDIGLDRSMIPLGSCTMKLNPAVSLFHLTAPRFANMHPFSPSEQTGGYLRLIRELEKMLCEITGFDGCSLQPNSGASGEYAGLLVIRDYLQNIGETERQLVLIPRSAHGTNPASAIAAGMKILVVECDEKGNISVDDLRAKAEENAACLAALMITYPSTHGVFEDSITEIVDIVHQNGGQVYLDGANMNAQCGYTSPAIIGADVCHLNLHKTFAIPHGGGGPGAGPICVGKHLIPFLPGHRHLAHNQEAVVAAAPYGSALILPISYIYLSMLNSEDLREATATAVLHANYIAHRFQEEGLKILYTGKSGRVAHELIWDCRELVQQAGLSATDIAKRLMDYGIHAPTLSFPVANTLMIEPTESEPKKELDRFIEAIIEIVGEIKDVIQNPTKDNPLANAPHTLNELTQEEWKHSYSRERAAFPVKSLKEDKYWTPVGRIDDAFGDRNFFCTCESL